MREKPILFSAPMVRAILSGAKTVTRRIVKDQTLYRDDGDVWTGFLGWQPLEWALENQGACGRGCIPRWSVGDRLWVRETWKPHSLYAGMKPSQIPQTKVFFAADEEYAPNNTPWVPSIFMPRWASRITMEVTGVRVERLQSITEADAVAEGVMTTDFARPDHPASICYSVLWDHINGAGSWDANPWVVAVEFRRVAAAIAGLEVSDAE